MVLVVGAANGVLASGARRSLGKMAVVVKTVLGSHFGVGVRAFQPWRNGRSFGDGAKSHCLVTVRRTGRHLGC